MQHRRGTGLREDMHMSKKKNDDIDFEAIVDDARENFDLGDFLRGRSIRTKSVRVFTDEVTAEERGGYEAYTEEVNGINVPRIRSWGLVAKLAEIQDEYERLSPKTSKEAKQLKGKITTITSEIEALTAKLLESALDIELQAVPKIAKKVAYREAKKFLGIRGKVREEQFVDLIDEQNAQLLHRTVVSVTRRSDGKRNEGMTVQSARDLMGHLPDSEWDKIEEKVNELLVQKVISDQAVADPDF